MDWHTRQQNRELAKLRSTWVLKAFINPERNVVALDVLGGGRLYLTWEGDCCARCFLAHVQGVEELLEASIIDAYSAEWRDIQRDEDPQEDVIESMGTIIRTEKGDVAFETRLEHNGYYGGSIKVTNEAPKYVDSGDFFQESEMQPLVDF